jgi:hypothetical protein
MQNTSSVALCVDFVPKLIGSLAGSDIWGLSIKLPNF